MKNKEKPIKLLLKWAGKDKYYLYLAVICSLISGICTMIPYYGIYQLLNALYQGNCTKELMLHESIVITIGVTIRFTLFAVSGALSHRGAYNALYKVRCMIVEHMAKVPLGRLSEHHTGAIKTVLNEDIEKLELFLAHHLPELVYYLCGPIVVFIYLCTVNLPLALISLVPLILALGVMGIMFSGMGSMMEDANNALTHLNAAIIEYVSGMKLIKAYNMGSASFKKFGKAIEEENKIWNKISKKMGPPYAAYVIVVECGMLLMVPLGGYLFLKGSIAVSTLLLFVFVGSLYLTELRPLQELGSNLAQVMNGVIRTKEILDIPVFEGGEEFPEDHEIKIEDVSFAYPLRPDKEVLTKCNLTIHHGEKVALVGKSGAGKSTIIELIARFYDVDQGKVTIGGKDVRSLNYEKLLQQVSIVFQKTFLTRDSVLENIKMGKEASLKEVREAAKKAQIDDFIMSLPEQYNTKVGSFGTRFSGGEKQRIAIARAILKDAPILILDEATSAADPENQVEIDKAIQKLCEGKTVIIVAHRLSALKICDRIAVVEDHTVRCIGTHEEVFASNEYYHKAWEDSEKARKMTYSLEGGRTYE